jgi:hypothetical protein
MREIHKQVMLDEHGKPVAVQIAWAEWLEVESALRMVAHDASESQSSTSERPVQSAADADAAQRAMVALWGTMQGLSIDPLDYQRRMRSEWDRAWETPNGQSENS